MSRFLSRFFLSKPLCKSNSNRKRKERLTRLALESLEKRDLPSATSMPSPDAQEAAGTSLMASMMDQWMRLVATVEQDISNALNALGQDIAQEVSYVQQQWDRLLGINPTIPNPSPNNTAPQPSSASGAGQGSGSGTATTANEGDTGLGNITAKPMTGGGGGSGGGSSSGLGGGGTGGTTGSTGAGPAVQRAEG